MVNYKKIITFLSLTFICSWSIWIYGIINIDPSNPESINNYRIFTIIGVYGPTLGAIFTTLIFNKIVSIKELLNKIFIWKIPFKNYLYSIFLPIIFLSMGIGIFSIFFEPIGRFEKLTVFFLPTILLSKIYVGPLGEELGWRGFLLPEFQKIFSNIKSAIIIGVIWFIWHIPLFWAPFGTLISRGEITFIPTLTFLIMLICMSIILTWLVTNSKGSILVAILFHLFFNAGIPIMFFPEIGIYAKQLYLFTTIGMVIFSGYLIMTEKLESNRT